MSFVEQNSRVTCNKYIYYNIYYIFYYTYICINNIIIILIFSMYIYTEEALILVPIFNEHCRSSVYRLG